MRNAIVSYLQDNIVDGFSVSTELPWISDGTPLYMKNFKYLYVGAGDTEQETLYDTLDGGGAVNETLIYTVTVATDAKNLPDTYSSMELMVKGMRIDALSTGYTQRLTKVAKTYEADALITEFEVTFTKLIVN